MRAKNATLLALLALCLASLSLGTGACGSPAPAIQHRMPMDMLAQTPPADRTPVAEAYRNHYKAQLELDHVDFQLSDIAYEIKIARAEKAQRKHALRIAKLEGKRSQASFKASLAKAADALLNGMKKEKLAQGERLRYLKAQQTFLRRERSHRKLALVHADATFELAKAKLAKQRDTVPKGFKLAKFVSQEKRAKSKALKKSQSAKSAQSKAKARHQAWKKASK